MIYGYVRVSSRNQNEDRQMKEFAPLKCNTASGPDDIDNISMLKAVSHKIEYGRVVGMNKTDITLK